MDERETKLNEWGKNRHADKTLHFGWMDEFMDVIMLTVKSLRFNLNLYRL